MKAITNDNWKATREDENYSRFRMNVTRKDFKVKGYLSVNKRTGNAVATIMLDVNGKACFVDGFGKESMDAITKTFNNFIKEHVYG